MLYYWGHGILGRLRLPIDVKDRGLKLPRRGAFGPKTALYVLINFLSTTSKSPVTPKNIIFLYFVQVCVPPANRPDKFAGLDIFVNQGVGFCSAQKPRHYKKNYFLLKESL